MCNVILHTCITLSGYAYADLINSEVIKLVSLEGGLLTLPDLVTTAGFAAGSLDVTFVCELVDAAAG